jgi:diaminohydroxyphosphoribosylaminopyrimidine deaminase/5-amino-6-(5-phosphoribosylamino)uracil reductase
LTHHSALEGGFTLGGPLDSLFNRAADVSSVQIPSLATDRYWMLEALRISLQGVGIAPPNPAVGCIIVDENQTEITRGHTHSYGGRHAEKDAFESLLNTRAHQNRLQNATAYVTLEPCSHFGKQPPCTDLFIQSKLQRIVISTTDPHSVVNGQGVRALIAAGKKVEVGIYANECRAWNLPFFTEKIFNHPLIALKWAQTLDGQLADDSHQSKWITGPQARSYTHWLRLKYDAILIGVGTLLSDLPQLSARDVPELVQAGPSHSQRPLNLNSHPLPIVVDTAGKLFKLSKSEQKVILEKTFLGQRRCIIFTKGLSEKEILKDKQLSWISTHENITVVPFLGADFKSEFYAFLRSEAVTSTLGRPLQSLMAEGGPSLLSHFIETGLGDVLHCFLSPQITGGESYRIKTPHLLKNSHRFELLSTFRLGPDTVLELVSPKIAQKIFGN